MTSLWVFLAGLITGTTLGVGIMACLNASRNDRRESQADAESEWDARCQSLRVDVPPQLTERIWENIEPRLHL